jgi:hypothetical protein
VTDDFVAQHGRDADKVYTLEKMRREEALAENMFAENTSSRQGSNYDLVEEVYENINNFDRKIKE